MRLVSVPDRVVADVGASTRSMSSRLEFFAGLGAAPCSQTSPSAVKPFRVARSRFDSSTTAAAYSRVTIPEAKHPKCMQGVFAGLFLPVAFLLGQSFKVDDVKIVGDLKYGQTSDPVACSAGPSYCAFVFNGQGNDRIEVNVNGGDGTAFVAIADGTLAQLTSGTNQVVFSLPKKGPDAEAYYIVFRDREGKPGRFTVALRKLEK